MMSKMMGSLELRVQNEIEEIHAAISSCKKCRHRDEVSAPIHGYGSKEPKLVVFGQYPGRGEDVLGFPFAKEVGRYIRETFYKGLTMSDTEIYWSNVVCCPIPTWIENDAPEWQLQNCSEFLENLLDTLNPAMIVGLGNGARSRLFSPRTMEFQRKVAGSLLDSRFRVWDYRGFPLVIVSNPAAALKKRGFEKDLFMKDVENDMEFLSKTLKESGIWNSQR